MTSSLISTGVIFVVVYFAVVYFAIGYVFDAFIRGHSHRKTLKAKGLETLIATVLFVILKQLIE